VRRKRGEHCLGEYQGKAQRHVTSSGRKQRGDQYNKKKTQMTFREHLCTERGELKGKGGAVREGEV